MLTLTAGLKINYFIDLKIFQLTSKQGAAQRRTEHAWHEMKIK
jgi:uncharacterized protein YjbK